jgi:hypothetical protein
MQLYFAGAEVASHFSVLKECGVTRVAVSANNLSRIAKDEKLAVWANRARLAGLEWVLYADSVHTPISIVTTVLAGADIQPEAVCGPIEWYDTTWLKDSDLLFLPSWDGTDPALLREYVEDFDGVLLPDSAVDNPTTVRAAKAALPTLGTLAALTGRTKGLERFDMLLSSAWWAVQKHGETQVWAGDRFIRLNANDKHLKRQKYADAIAALGVDVDKVLADDPYETLRLAVKSWLRLEEHIAAGRVAQHPQPQPLVTNPLPGTNPSNVVPLQVPVAKPPSLTRHEVLPVITTTRSTTMVLGPDGQQVEEHSDVLTVSPVVMRQCNTCSLQIGCPGFQPNAPCRYQIPVTIRTKTELDGVLRALVEIQTQRILQGRFAEEIKGEADVLVGIELDRLFKMVERWRNIQDNRDSLKITVDAKGAGQAQAQMGMISRLFGEKAGQNAMRLESPIDAEEVIDQVTGEDEES